MASFILREPVTMVLLGLLAALVLISLSATATAAPTADTPFAEVTFVEKVGAETTTPTPTAEAEVNQHVGRIAAIFFSVFGTVWLLLSFFLAYVFICICPERHTK